MAEERKPDWSSAEPGKHFDVFRRLSGPTVYADGVNVSAGPGVSKLEFFTTAKIEETTSALGPKETREVTLVLAIPTHALIETCINVLSMLSSSAEAVKGGTAKQANALVDLLQRVKIGP